MAKATREFESTVSLRITPEDYECIRYYAYVRRVKHTVLLREAINDYTQKLERENGPRKVI